MQKKYRLWNGVLDFRGVNETLGTYIDILCLCYQSFSIPHIHNTNDMGIGHSDIQQMYHIHT